MKSSFRTFSICKTLWTHDSLDYVHSKFHTICHAQAVQTVISLELVQVDVKQ